MINYDSIISVFNEKGTLLKWLKKVEKALKESVLTNVDVITISTQQIQLKFNFEDGTSLTTPTITLPKGDKGDTGATGQTGETGATGVGVSNVTVNASNHLIVTLTDETEIDAGEINVTSGVVIDTSMSASSENPVQNKVIYTALAGKQDKIVDSDEIIVNETNKLMLNNTLSNKINNTMQLPTTAPTATELVGIDMNGAQTAVTIGDGLEIVNGVLQVKPVIPKGFTVSYTNNGESSAPADFKINGGNYTTIMEASGTFENVKTIQFYLNKDENYACTIKSTTLGINLSANSASLSDTYTLTQDVTDIVISWEPVMSI